MENLENKNDKKDEKDLEINQEKESNTDIKKENKKKRITLIIVLVIIVGLVFGVWLISENEERKEALANMNSELIITKLELDKLKELELPMILDFGSDSCIPCVEMEPVLQKLNEEYKEKAIIHFGDIIKYPGIQRELPVSVMPTQVFIEADGTPYVPSKEILETISGFQIYEDDETGEHTYTTHQGGLTETQMVAILDEMGAKI